MPRKPAAPVSIQHGKRYRRQRQRQSLRPIVAILGGAALLGTAIGAGSSMMGQGQSVGLLDQVKPLAIKFGLIRARSPQPGDVWSGCNAARAAGTAPIYVGEPGYREGVPCEATRSRLPPEAYQPLAAAAFFRPGFLPAAMITLPGAVMRPPPLL